jgi:hypothetical protein
MKDRGKYLARQRRYNRSEKGRARSERYEAKFIHVPYPWSGMKGFPPIRIPRTPENEVRARALAEKINEFVFKQAREAESFRASLGEPVSEPVSDEDLLEMFARNAQAMLDVAVNN